jgi:hypothetical protein
MLEIKSETLTSVQKDLALATYKTELKSWMDCCKGYKLRPCRCLYPLQNNLTKQMEFSPTLTTHSKLKHKNSIQTIALNEIDVIYHTKIAKTIYARAKDCNSLQICYI